MPGPVGLSTHRGSNRLIRDGACVILDEADLFAALGLRRSRGREAVHPPPVPADPSSAAVVEACRFQARTLESIAAVTGLGLESTLEQVALLELEGWLERLPGARFLCGRKGHTWILHGGFPV